MSFPISHYRRGNITTYSGAYRAKLAAEPNLTVEQRHRELESLGFSARQLKQGGFTLRELKEAGFDLGLEFTTEELVQAGFSMGEVARWLLTSALSPSAAEEDLGRCFPYYAFRAVEGAAAEEEESDFKDAPPGKDLFLAAFNDVLNAEDEKSAHWQCLIDGGIWKDYDVDTTIALEDAWLHGKGWLSFHRTGIKYLADLRAMKQARKDGMYDTERQIRRILVPIDS